VELVYSDGYTFDRNEKNRTLGKRYRNFGLNAYQANPLQITNALESVELYLHSFVISASIGHERRSSGLSC
jgi:hypothetical protein